MAMQKPDPKQSSISDIFTQYRDIEYEKDQLEPLKENGTPLLDPEDPIMMSKDDLDIVLVEIIQSNNITYEYFSEKYNEYAMRVKGYHINQTSNNKSNTLKAIKNGGITKKRFNEMIIILGMKPVLYRYDFIYNGKRVSYQIGDDPDSK